jgi:hypothetical protein
MAFTNRLFVPLDQTKPHREAQSIVLIVSVGCACPVRVNLKRGVDEMTLLEFDPIPFKRLVQSHGNPLLQASD